MKRTIPWPRIFVEGAVIVVSILLALAADAWWSRAELRRDVEQELENVAEELRSNRGLLVFQIDLMERMASGSEALTGLLGSQPDVALLSVPDTLVWLSVQGPTLNASFGAVDALVASGRLAAVEVAETREGLAALRSLVGDVVEDQDRARDLYDDRLTPLLFAVVNYDRVAQIGQSFWTQDRVAGRPLVGSGDMAYPNSREIRNYMTMRRLMYVATIAESRDLVAELDTLLDRIVG